MPPWKAEFHVKWFGASWGAPVCDPALASETPVGRPCGHCDGPIAAGDRGVILPFLGAETEPKELAYHHACILESLGIKERPTEVVHVLHYGAPLCGFTTTIPRNWPEGHKWVSSLEPESANCETCLIKMRSQL